MFIVIKTFYYILSVILLTLHISQPDAISFKLHVILVSKLTGFSKSLVLSEYTPYTFEFCQQKVTTAI